MSPVSGDSTEKKKSRFSLGKKKKEEKPSPEKKDESPGPDAGLLSPQSSEKAGSDADSLRTSNPSINTPEGTPKKGSRLNMSFRKKNKGI